MQCSFGGILVQEMAAFLQSQKSNNNINVQKYLQLQKQMKIAKRTSL
jgi:hypothetical protein